MHDKSTLQNSTNSPPDDNSPAVGLLGSDPEQFVRLLTTASVTDLIHAEIFAAMHKRELAFVPGWGWMIFNGKYWEGAEHRILGLAGEVIKRRIAAFRQTDFSGQKPETKQILARLDGFSNEARLAGMIRLAEGMLHVPAAMFDGDPYHLNVGNWVSP